MNRKSGIKNLKFPLHRIRRRLLAWYEKNRRDLPWRRTRDPYAIWIAETMLQQTQVKNVLPYYRSFLKAFPSIESLNRASRRAVLALWSGLGYYRRAENLKAAARIIIREHRGEMPREFDDLLALPGIGPYTAGALMSIAFNQSFPALDGNARRVLSRLFGVNKDKDLHGIATRVVTPSNPGEFNQALMELGSTVCLARNPLCPQCPLSLLCRARRASGLRPKAGSPPKRVTKKVQWPLVVVQYKNKILLRRRPAEGILAGLWEVPGSERKKGESLKAALKRHLNGLAQMIRPDRLVGEIRHSITGRTIRAPVFLCPNGKGASLPDRGWRWVPTSSLHRYPLSSLSLKAIQLALRR